MANWESVEGLPYPLGQSWVAAEASYNFALYSKNATRVTLLLYREDDLVNPVFRLDLDPLKQKSGRIWHARVKRDDSRAERYYAYQIDGPPPGPGYDRHAFDFQKILLDPYARAVYFPPSADRRTASSPGSDAGKAPLGVLFEEDPATATSPPRSAPHESDLVIYEMHVKGFTASPSSGLPPSTRGTFAGVVTKIPYLMDLGITAVELMPVHQYDPTTNNYWGYDPIGLFAPHAEYSSDRSAGGPRKEFRAMVDALHEAGIEVLLDVVYNHTGEGAVDGPIYSFKGIDNSTYYLINPDGPDPYRDYAGTGNTLHCANSAVRRLVVDSLRYWAVTMGVDGFRFDLASIFARNDDGSLNLDDPPIFDQIAGDPALGGIRLIAEPWDAGGGYLLGRRFPGTAWFQWNGRYRDTLQGFVKGDPGLVGALMGRVYGSSDLFADDPATASHAYQSVNYITSHDGFTLYDLTAYNGKHNQANGNNNTDGPNDLSWNCGWEGDVGAPTDVLRLRRRQIKNFATLLLLSNGTPMFRMGDEFGQTQGGNNNPYNQDNATSWLDWGRLADNAELYRYFKQMIAFRKAHPSLSRSRFWRADVSWYGVGPSVDLSEDSHALAICVHGASVGDVDVYAMINAYWGPLTFRVQEWQAGAWRLAADTSLDSPGDIYGPGAGPILGSPDYTAGPRSVVVLVKS